MLPPPTDLWFFVLLQRAAGCASNLEAERNSLALVSSMGAKQSHPIMNGSDSRDCQSCFFLDGVAHSFRTSGRASDPIGTPLPETPLHLRRKRAQVQEAIRNESKPVFSSKYAGLEKEVSQIEDVDDDTVIHDGPDCEKLLHQKYQLMEVLGVGSTSTVHKILCKHDDMYYACKIIDCELIEERYAGMMAQFQTEIAALKELRHPGIIRLYDVYLTDKKIYIVMEMMEGGELFDYVVQKGTLTEGEAARIVKKVTSALAYMHSKHFIHRDLKPENLLLKQKPKTPYDDIEVKVIDFGLSKVIYSTVWVFVLLGFKVTHAFGCPC